MVPRPLAPARAMSSRTCADVIQPCQSRVDYEPRSAHGRALKKNKNKPRVDYEPRSAHGRVLNKPPNTKFPSKAILCLHVTSSSSKITN